MNILGDCRDCGKPMVSQWKWRMADRDALREQGITYHANRGRCAACAARFDRWGEAGPPRRRGHDLIVHTCEVCGGEMVIRQWMERYPHLRDQYLLYGSKGLCKPDYDRARRRGKVTRVTRSREEVLEEWVMLRDNGTTDIGQAAERMGMTRSALDQALYRARKRGDERGSLIPFGHDMRRAA